MTRRPSIGLAVLTLAAGLAAAEERTTSFDRDPGWDGGNHRSAAFAPRRIVQEFGYSPATAHAGGAPGEIGGLITPAAEPAYYAKKIPTRTFADRLTASGKLACTGQQFHLLIGFFNRDTLNEWRTPNTIALRLAGRGDRFYAFVEYCTGKWRAGGDNPGGFARVPDLASGRLQPRGFALGAVHTWSLTYDPHANGGDGSITVTLDDESSVCDLDSGHRADGATFNRFGLLPVMKHADDGGEVWVDDVTLLGESQRFDRDPQWSGFRNRRTYTTTEVRPRFDFGYRTTRYAGGRSVGEMGGLIFRGDCRFPDRMAFYADRLATLDLEKPLHASGRVCLRRGVTDSTVLLGFFHSTDSMAVSDAQDDGLPRSFLGVAIEGPSREGFLFYPLYRASEGHSHSAVGLRPPYIYPDGRSHAWTLDYTPLERGGEIRVTLDGKEVGLPVTHADRAVGGRFDRFGVVTTWIDGNGQLVYFDDLTYTCRQP